MMKFGLLTAILDGWTFEEAVDIASEMGFKCLEVACWPAGKAERRYAGVSHIDCERVCEDDEYTAYVKNLVTSGRCSSISCLMTSALQRNIPEFQKNSPVPISTCAKALSGFSVNVFTGIGSWLLYASLPPQAWM